MPTYTVNGITWNYYLVGVAPNQTAGIGDNTYTSGNATNPTSALSGAVTIPGTVTDGTTTYTVTAIGVFSFVSKNNVTSVIIPNSVTNIIYAAFYNMSNLSSVTLGNSVTTLEDYIFYNCTSLTSINIPDSLTSISTVSVFAGTSSNLVITMSNGKFGITVPSTNQTFYGTSGNPSVDFVLPPQPPSMTITSATVTSGSTTKNETILLTFTSSASTTDFFVTDISLNNGTLSSPLGGSGAVYTATFTPLNQGACTINVAAGVFTAGGLNNTASNTFTWTFDSVRPSMTITSTTVTSGSTTNNATIALTFTSSEATTNFVKEDITLTNGSLFTSFTAISQTVYNAIFTPNGQGACTIDVSGGAYTDAVGNTNTAATRFNWTFDSVSPSMTITSTTVNSGSTTNNAFIALTFTSTEATNNFGVGGISLTNGSLSSSFTAISPTVYTATFTPNGQGACTIGVAAGAYTDAATNLNNLATQFNWTFDSVPPTMTITSTTVTTGSITNNATIALTFTSSKATTNFLVGGISLTNGTLSSSFTAISATVYNATFTPNGQGACAIGVAAGAYTDAAGNTNAAATIFTWTFDNISPSMTITSTTVNSGSITNNTSIALTFTSSEATTNFAAEDISLTNGTLSSSFTAISPTVYTATFTPTGEGVCAVDVAAGAYTDAATNLNNLATQFTWTFDSGRPTMTITSTTYGVTSGSTTNNASIELTFTSSEATNNFVVGDISLTNGTLTNFAGSGTVYTATFTPTYLGACTIDVAAGAYTDAAGNTNTAATTFNWSFEVVDYGNVTPTSLSFVNNTLAILNRIDSADVDAVAFDVNAGSLLYSLEVTSLYNANSISYVLDISGGSTVSSGTFTQAGVNLLNGAFLEQVTNTTYNLTLTSSGSNIYSIVGKSLNAGYTLANALSVGYIPNFAYFNEANKLEQTYISGFLDVSGEIIHRSNDVTIMDGKLLVSSGDMSLNSGNLYVAGNVSMNSNMMVTGETALTNIVTLGRLDVSGATTLDSTLTVAGATILNNVARIVDNSIFAVGTGATTMEGNVSMNSQLSVAGDVSMNSTLQVVGATSLKNTTVAGILTLNSTPAFLNDISFNGSRIDICGNLYANYPVNSIPVAAIIGGGGNIIDVDASMNAGLNVSGATTLSSFAVSNNTSVGGTLIVAGATTMSSLNTTSNASVGGMLTIAGTARFLNDVSFIGSRIDICGNLYATYPNSSIPLSAVSGGNMTVYNTDVSLNARLNVAGATTLASTLAVTGKTTFSNDISFSGPRIDICGNLFAKYASNSIPQSAIIGGVGSLFTTDVSVNAGLYVQGKINLGSATMQYKETPIVGVYIDPLTSGNIVTTGNSTVGNVLSIVAGTAMANLVSTGNSAINGTLIVTGATTSTNLNASSNAIIGGALTIAGITTFPNDTSMNSRLVVAGDVSLNTKITVAADVSANARFSVGGDVSMNSTMRVAGDTTLNAVTISGALTATGATTINSTLAVTGATTIGGVWNVAGAMPFTTDVSMNSRLSVGGDVSMNAKLFVAGATTMSTLTASSNGTMGGTLAVTGTSTFAAMVTMNSKLTVIGDVSMNARLAVVTNNASIGGALGIIGATTLSTLTATSNASLGSTLAVTGITTFSSDVSLNGTSVDIAGNLTASGYTLGNATLQYKTLMWTQLGSDIDGKAANDMFGRSVAISSDGSIVAIGASSNDGTTANASDNRGSVQVYQRDASAPIGWKQLGNDINGEFLGDRSGNCISLSGDGTIVAIGAWANDGTTANAADERGHVRVYRINLANTALGWVKIGNDIDGEAANDNSGTSVSLSRDGWVVAIGANANDGTTGISGDDRGHVRVYRRNLSDVWEKVGDDIDGEAAGDNSGWSVSLSSNGSTVAIGAYRNDGTSGTSGDNRGSVRVYRIDLSNTALGWAKLGNDIDGEAAGDQSGWSVAISDNGTIVAIGATNNDGTNPGIPTDNRGSVRVYQLISNVWTQLGGDIDGEVAADLSGYSVALSSDGSIVAIGANQNDGSSGTDRGHVRVYQRNTFNSTIVPFGWTQLGSDIDGETESNQSGISVSLSSDGSTMVIGAPYNGGTSGDSRGHTRVYKRDISIPITGLYINAPMLTSNLQTAGYATVGGILGVIGATTTNSTLSIVGATTMTSLTAGSNATIGGTLTINGTTTLSSTLNITGATTTSALTTSSNASVGGTLNVTGATTLTALNYSDKIMQW